MRTPVLRHCSRQRARQLARVSLIALTAATVSACSSDFTRFDRTLRSALPQSANQQTAQQNPYPGEVDPATTASIAPANGAPQPLGQVDPYRSEPDHAGYSPQQPNYNSGVVSQKLPDPVGAPRPAVDRTVTGSLAPQQPAAAGGTITVQPGDTLLGLARRHGVSLSAMMRANQISDASSIRIGQHLVLPGAGGTVARADGTYGPAPKTPIKTAGTARVSTPVADTAGTLGDQKKLIENRQTTLQSQASRLGADSGRYVVKAGDSLSSIAGRHAVSVKSLMDINRLTSASIHIGQQLTIPGGGAAAPVRAAEIKSAEMQGPKAYTKPTVDDTVTGSVDTKAPESTGIKTLRWPVNGRIISAYGDRHGDDRNDGIDISVPEGTVVRAAENGVVIYSGSDLEDFGNLVLIRHDGGLVTAYAHNKQNSVAKGAKVRRGDQVALSGRTGDARAPILHFEVRKDAKPVNPEKYLGG
ncbi:MAG: peptidoglycan DD-metalloendopeptidase family protein [Nitratireductor sp.]|nr:peptidoglycan DD-metalloendopeptidase family protein [Nitratireductor sp.]